MSTEKTRSAYFFGGQGLTFFVSQFSLTNLSLHCSKIWEKFVEFEAGVGDLASLLKVERRRAATIKPEVHVS